MTVETTGDAVLETMRKVIEVLEALDDDRARQRVLCAVAIMHGQYELAKRILAHLEQTDRG